MFLLLPPAFHGTSVNGEREREKKDLNLRSKQLTLLCCVYVLLLHMFVL